MVVGMEVMVECCSSSRGKGRCNIDSSSQLMFILNTLGPSRVRRLHWMVDLDELVLG
jgi:hypothetical protein